MEHDRPTALFKSDHVRGRARADWRLSAASGVTSDVRPRRQVRDYDGVHPHVLQMADTLSDGIMRQLPKRFP